MHMAVYRVAQMGCVEMGVNLCCEDIFVAQELLYLTYVGTSLQQVCGERVAESVRADLLINASIFCCLFDDCENHHSGELRASIVQKNSILLAAIGTTLLQVELNTVTGYAAYRNQSLLVALSRYTNITLTKEEVAEFKLA